MKKKSNLISSFFLKIAAIRFAKKGKIILIIFSLIFVTAVNKMILSWIEVTKNKIKVIEITTPPLIVNKNTTAAINPKPEENNSEVKKPFRFDIRDPFLASKDPDKFKPANIQKKTVIDLKISGIIWDEKVPTAIINSKVVKIGDIIDDKTVVDMEKDKVILMENGQLYILELRKK